MLEHDTLMAYLDQWAEEKPHEIWLRDLKGEGSDDYSWSESRRQDLFYSESLSCLD